MKNIFKYIGIASLLLFAFYYTEKFSVIVMNNTSLVKEINSNSNKYKIEPVSAIIDDEYIIPGLNGYAVNILKSYDKMRMLDEFNDYYLEYDIIKPSVSLDNNKDKIIKYGNSNKNSVAIILQNNNDIIDYSANNNIKITRLVDVNTFDNNHLYEQINNDFNNYEELERLFKKNNLKSNMCYYDQRIIDNCLNKYLFEESIVLNNYNISNVKNNIKNGYIILIRDNVSLIDYKLLVKQIYYQDLDIVYLSTLVKEERD